MRISALLLALFMSLCFGCATVQRCSEFGGLYVDGNNRPVASVAVENYGYYLFGVLPLICGNPEEPNENDFKLFTDTVTVDGNMRILAKVAEEMKAPIIGNVRTHYDESGAWSLCLIYKRVIFTGAILSAPKNEEGK